MSLFFWYPASILNCWHFRHLSPCPVYMAIEIKIRESVQARQKHSTSSATSSAHKLLLSLGSLPLTCEHVQLYWEKMRDSNGQSQVIPAQVIPKQPFFSDSPSTKPSHMNRHSRDQPNTAQLWRSLSHSIHMGENNKQWLFKVTVFEGGLFCSLIRQALTCVTCPLGG